MSSVSGRFSNGSAPAAATTSTTWGAPATRRNSRLRALHSEQNASKDESLRFIQIWILPDTPGLKPEVEQRVFTREERTNRLLKVMGPKGGDVVKIHQDASLYIASLEPGTEVTHEIGD